MEINKNCIVKISILVCSKSRRKDLENLVTILTRMSTGLNYEIIAVEETEKHSPIEGALYISHPVENKGFPYARNLALQNASGEIVVFVDDDCIVQEGWLDNLLEPFRDDSVVGVQGGVTVPSDTNAVGWAESLLGFPGGGIRRVVQAKGEIQETKYISSLNCAYRKWIVDKVGGFEESLKWGAEDYFLGESACKLGKCVFAPSALVSHAARGSLSKIFLWFYRRGRSEVGVARVDNQKDTTVWTILKSSLTAKLLLAFLICIVVLDWSETLIVFFLIAYIFFQYCRYFKAWHLSSTPFMTLAWLPFVKLTMDLGADWGRIRGIILD